MKLRTKLKLTSILTVIATVLSLTAPTTSAFAAETASSTSALTNVEEATVLRQKLNTLLGETVEPMADYKTDYWGYCTVTNYHQGGNHTIYGNQARLAVAFKPLDGNGALSTSLTTGFGTFTPLYNPGAVDSDGYYMYVSDWKKVTFQGSYNIFYKIWTTGNGGVYDGRRAHFHVWIDYK